MTDLERARWLLPEGTDQLEVHALAAALAAARHEGAEEMRERAAGVVEAYPGYPRKRLDWEERVIRACVDGIRALPLTPEVPA